MITWLGTADIGTFYHGPNRASHKKILGSFHDKRIGDAMESVLSPHNFDTFLDSGAYSAWSRGASIDLDEYCAFIKANIEHITVYSNLDCIPGQKGKPPTAKEKEEAAARSWDNFLYMRNEGLSPLPVYHVGESTSWLHKMLDYGCDYIGLGGLVGTPAPVRRRWLDSVFSMITDQHGAPMVKTHGFGVTSMPLMFRYPWYSVDSTSWIRVAASGCIYLPHSENGSFQFNRTPSIISVSNRNALGQRESSKNYSNLHRYQQELVLKWLDMCGVSLADCQNDYGARATVTAYFFKMVSAAKLETTSAFKQVKTKELFP